MQGVVKAYDPTTRSGVLVDDVELAEHDLSASALEGSVFRMLRQGQRVVFDLDRDGLATHIRLGSEPDMGTPGFEASGASSDLARGAGSGASRGGGGKED